MALSLSDNAFAFRAFRNIVPLGSHHLAMLDIFSGTDKSVPWYGRSSYLNAVLSAG